MSDVESIAKNSGKKLSAASKLLTLSAMFFFSLQEIELKHKWNGIAAISGMDLPYSHFPALELGIACEIL